MRKIIALTLCFIMASAVFAFADGEPFANAGEIYQSWYEEALDYPYPEYVTGVVSTDGGMENLTFYIMKGFEDQAKAEILDQVADKDSVTFAEGGKYTLAQLCEVQNYVSDKMAEGKGSYPVVGCYVSETANVMHCDVDMSKENAQAIIDELSYKYGDMITFTEGSNAVVTTAEMAEVDPGFSVDPLPVSSIIAYILIGIGVAAIIASVIILRKKKHRS